MLLLGKDVHEAESLVQTAEPYTIGIFVDLVRDWENHQTNAGLND